MTLRVLSRSLMQTSSPSEFASLARLIHDLHYPPHSMDSVSRYRNAHSPPDHIITSILWGVPDSCPQLLLDCITVRLSQCHGSDFDNVFHFVSMLMNIELSGWLFIFEAVCHSTALFTSGSLRIRELPLVRTPDLASTIDPILKTTSAVALCINRIEAELDHRQHFVKAFVQSMFFEALEYALAPELASTNTFGRCYVTSAANLLIAWL